MQTVIFALASGRSHALSKIVAAKASQLANETNSSIYTLGKLSIPNCKQKVIHFAKESKISESIEKILYYANSQAAIKVIVVCDDPDLVMKAQVLSPPSLKIRSKLVAGIKLRKTPSY